MLVLTSGVEKASHGEIAILVVGIFVGIIWLIIGYLLVSLPNICHEPLNGYFAQHSMFFTKIIYICVLVQMLIAEKGGI